MAEVAVSRDSESPEFDFEIAEATSPHWADAIPNVDSPEADQTAPDASRRHLIALFLSVAALICVEAALIAPGHVLAGEISDAVLLVLLLQVAPDKARVSVASWNASAALRALAVVPLIRLVALGLPLRVGSDQAEVLIVAVLVGFAALGLAPGVGIERRSLVARRLPLWQVAAALAGLVLGFVAYVLGAPALWSSGAGGARVVLALIAAACAAVVEEIVFRGIVQLTLQRAAGRVGALAASALFVAISLELISTSLVLVLALAGLVFANTVARTGTLRGPVAGHVLLVIGAGGIWPTLLGRPHPLSLSQSGATIGLALAVACMTAILISRPMMMDRPASA